MESIGVVTRSDAGVIILSLQPTFVYLSRERGNSVIEYLKQADCQCEAILSLGQIGGNTLVFQHLRCDIALER